MQLIPAIVESSSDMVCPNIPARVAFEIIERADPQSWQDRRIACEIRNLFAESLVKPIPSALAEMRSNCINHSPV